MVPVEILLNFGNYFRTLQLGFLKFLSGIVFLHHYVRTIGLFFHRPIRFDQSPEPLIQIENRWEPLHSTVRNPLLLGTRVVLGYHNYQTCNHSMYKSPF